MTIPQLYHYTRGDGEDVDPEQQAACLEWRFRFEDEARRRGAIRR